HHMFATGLTQVAAIIVAAASMTIAIPSGVQVFAWIATVASGRPLLRTPLLYVLGFVVVFVIGGLTGVMFAAIPFDQQVTDTYFVVAHFHYVLFGGAVFPILAGLFYWGPKMSGRLLDERLGQINFWLVFIGFNLTFFPMHVSGLLGMPRRVYTYPDGLGWDGLNLVSTIGSYVLAMGILAFVVNFFWSRSMGEPAGDNPWLAGTLELAISSPPPPYNFHVIPTVASAYPLWDTHAEYRHELLPDPEKMHRETVGTTVLEADPQAILNFPEDSPWPFIL